ncbi:hypothetical protein [Streptomyces sp. TLI_171]|uniref:hypothetical protein n=1 Tax=Streptomyces sp. TLI_171 TaxID=1938859 RepID=UPI000C17F0E6|nr:hypothetical protein [Streptomyces sp. TLI_171]RKE02912.1 hypothetical protein BX266_7515 [Streptomyces sp. TLI_171]
MEPITLAGPAFGSANAARAAIAPLVQVRAGGREDIQARCDDLEDAVLAYFYDPTAENEMTLRQAHLKLARRCTDERTRTAARTLTFHVINFRDSAFSRADLDELDAARRKNGTTAPTEARLYRWIEEFHQVVRRGRLVRVGESAGRWLRAANPARLLRRRSAPALPTVNRPEHPSP